MLTKKFKNEDKKRSPNRAYQFVEIDCIYILVNKSSKVPSNKLKFNLWGKPEFLKRALCHMSIQIRPLIMTWHGKYYFIP